MWQSTSLTVRQEWKGGERQERKKRKNRGRWWCSHLCDASPLCLPFPLPLPLSFWSRGGCCKLAWWGSQSVCQVRFCSGTISAPWMCKCSRVLGWMRGRVWPEHTCGPASPAVRYKGWESERWRCLWPSMLRGDSYRNCSCNLNTFQCKKKMSKRLNTCLFPVLRDLKGLLQSSLAVSPEWRETSLKTWGLFNGWCESPWLP